MQYSLDNAKTEFDFTIGNEPFKARFCNQNQYNANIHIYRSLPRLWFKKLRQYIVRVSKKLLGKPSSY